MARSARFAKSAAGAVRIGAVILASVAGAAVVGAQPLDDFEQRGIRFGAFNLFSQLGVGMVYTDNVFAVPDEGISVGPRTLPKDGDIYGLIQPQMRLESNFERHRLYFLGNASIARYNTYSSQDFNDWTLETGGRWDVTRTFAIDGVAGYDNLHESASDPDRRTFARSTTYDRFRLGAGFTQDWQRSFARYAFRYTKTEYDEVRLAGVDLNAGRDLDTYRNTLRVGYSPARQYDVFVEVRHILSDYESVPAPARNRDQQSFGVLLGAEVDFDRVVTGEFGFGVEYASYDDGITSDQTGFTFSGALDWTLTPRTVLGIEASRSLEPTDVVGASGTTTTAFGLNLSHTLSPRFSVGANASVEFENFVDSDRQDDTYSAGASAAYNFNRYLSVEGSYTYTTRQSDQFFREYDENLFFVSLVGRY